MAWVKKGVSTFLTVTYNSSGKKVKPIKSVLYFQKANLTSVNSGVKIERPPPFPYQEKRYTMVRAWLDGDCRKRFNDNTKLIVVDGPILAGKTKVCEAIAKEFDMKYFPTINLDSYYINKYGFDERKLDAILPKSCHHCDFETLHLRPSFRESCFVEVIMYKMRFEQYLDALAHLLHTGQGVVLERCPFSDYVFIDSISKQGYVTNAAMGYYNDMVFHTHPEILRPHLIVYLDVSTDVIMKRVKERNVHWEVNSKLINEKFLKDMESTYKNKYLQELSLHSELLVYDFSDVGDLEVEVLLEDVQRVDFDKYDRYDLKLRDWRRVRKWDWNQLRYEYSTNKDVLMQQTDIPRFDIDEVLIDGVDAHLLMEAWDNAPGNKYAKGFNRSMGDKNLWWKL